MSQADALAKHGDAFDGRSPLGRAVPRIDGPAKVTGAAPYALEHTLDGMLHCVLVQSTIGAGRVVAVDRSAAEASPGVRLLLDASNAPRLVAQSDFSGNKPVGTEYTPFATAIAFNGELVAAVVAETIEQAREAAALLEIDYAQSVPVATHDDPAAGPGTSVPMDKDWGDPDSALAEAAVVIDAIYETPREYNVPIEPHGLIAHWEADDRLTVHEPSQWIDGMAKVYATWFGLPFEKVRVVSPYIGGGFGSKAQALGHSAVAAIAARLLRRPVKLAVTRPQTFTAFGGRPATKQRLKIGATQDGKLLANRP